MEENKLDSLVAIANKKVSDRFNKLDSLVNAANEQVRLFYSKQKELPFLKRPEEGRDVVFPEDQPDVPQMSEVEMRPDLIRPDLPQQIADDKPQEVPSMPETGMKPDLIRPEIFPSVEGNDQPDTGSPDPLVELEPEDFDSPLSSDDKNLSSLEKSHEESYSDEYKKRRADSLRKFWKVQNAREDARKKRTASSSRRLKETEDRAKEVKRVRDLVNNIPRSVLFGYAGSELIDTIFDKILGE